MSVNQGNQELARLLGRVALGDQAAFRSLYRLTSGHLLGLAVGILERVTAPRTCCRRRS